MTNGMITEFDSAEVIRVRMRLGAEGYLVFVAVQELLCRDEHHKLKRDYDLLASEICVDAHVVKSVVEDLGLFVVGEYSFESESISKHYEERKRISAAKAKGGYARWKKSKNDEAKAQNNDANAAENGANAQESENNADLCLANAQDTAANAQDTAANAQDTAANAKIDKKKNSPIPPIKKNNLLTEGSKEKSKDFSLFTRACEERPKKSRKKPPNEESVRLNSGARKVFEEVFYRQFGIAYYWQGDDSGQMTKLLNKIRFSRTERPMPLPTDTDSMLLALRQFLDSINKDWIMKNFSVKKIASNYNEIISEIKIRQANGTVRLDPRRSAIVPRRVADDYDEKDD